MGNVNIMSTFQNKSAQKKAINHSSSAVFFALFDKENNVDTEISFLNHFLLKRGIAKVRAKVELRRLDGELLKEFDIDIIDPKVYTFKISDFFSKPFEGAAFIFFSSDENLAVPFCAVTAVIRSSKSCCGVHTYGRRLEQKELGSSIDLDETVETGWTLRDNEKFKSFAVFHNGVFETEVSFLIECMNYAGKILKINLHKTLIPFETFVLIPSHYDDKIVNFLNGKNGHAKVHIKGLKGVFPRLLCGNFCTKRSEKNIKMTNCSEIQFTHTNFDFSIMKQPDSLGNLGYINQPCLPSGYGMVYPVSTDKVIKINGEKYESASFQRFEISALEQLEVKCEDENLPSRFVPAAVGIWSKSSLESECSTSTFVEDYIHVPCHWHWGLLKSGLERGDSVISIMINKFGKNISFDRNLKLRVFSENDMILNTEVFVSENMRIKVMDLLPRKLPEGALWYVLSGDKLEDLNIFSTFYPINKSGFVEHAF